MKPYRVERHYNGFYWITPMFVRKISFNLMAKTNLKFLDFPIELKVTLEKVR